MSSDVEISNLALAHVGAEGDITGLDPELGEEERLCARFYPPCRRYVLSKHSWSFATKQQALTQTSTEPTDTRWAYMYQYPTDSLRIVKILNLADPDDPISYTVVHDATEGKVILTNLDDAIAEYVTDVDDESRFDPMFVLALSWWLAAHIAIPITGSADKRDHALRMYRATMPDTESRDANERQDGSEAQASWIAARA